jgi:alkylhydroperoxidase family enzyme
VARLPGVPEREASWLSRLIFRGIRKRTGSVGDTWTIAAHQPGLLLGWALHEFAYERANELDRRLRTLAQLKVAALVGCPA